jgi:hypothetical protein
VSRVIRNWPEASVTRTGVARDGSGDDTPGPSPPAPARASSDSCENRYRAVSRCGSFQPGRTKWQVYPFG